MILDTVYVFLLWITQARYAIITSEASFFPNLQ